MSALLPDRRSPVASGVPRVPRQSGGHGARGGRRDRRDRRDRAPFGSAARALTLAGLLSLAACADGPGERPSGAPAPSPAAGSPTAGAGVPVPGDFETLRNEAFRLMDGGAAEDEVLAALRAAHAADPGAYGVNARLGTVLSDARRHAEALAHWRAALEARPDERIARREVCSLAVSLGQAELALEVVGPLLDDPASEGDGRMLKARALDHLGRRAEALAALEGCDALPPDAAGPALSLWGQLLLEGGDPAGARQRFAAALAVRPDDQAAVRGLADTSRRLGDEAAAARWDEVLQLMVALRDNFFLRHHESPEDRKVQRQAGRQSEYIARELARRDERLRRLLELHPDWPEAWVQLADVLRQQDDHAGACQVIGQALERFADVLDGTALRARFCDG